MPKMSLKSSLAKYNEAKVLVKKASERVESLSKQLAEAKEHESQMLEQLGFYQSLAQDALDCEIYSLRMMGIVPSKRSEEEIEKIFELPVEG